MATITFTIDNAKLSRVVDALKGIYPIPKTNGVPDFTDNDWAKESVRIFIVDQVRKWENNQAREAANVEADYKLIS